MINGTDWDRWHEGYDDPHSSMSRRLRVIQQLVDDWLDWTAPRQVRVLSVCAGDGRDLLEVLARRTDAGRVTGVLLESDARNVRRAAQVIDDVPLDGIEIRQCDAADPASYAGAIPADLVLLAGIFGNVSDDDVRKVVEAVPGLCADDGLVIWTRHHRPPDLTPQIRSWFVAVGCVEQFFTAPDDAAYSVGASRLAASRRPWSPTGTLFTFVR